VTFNDQGARVWDWSQGRALTAPLPAPTTVQHLDFTSDSRHLVMVLADRSALYWELPSGLPLTLPGRSGADAELANLRGLETLPVERRSVAELQEIIRLVTGYEIHAESGLVPVDAARLRQAWEAQSH
jgi:WD40 repeat protein